MTTTSTISRRGLRRAAILLIGLTALSGAEAVAGSGLRSPALAAVPLTVCAVSVFSVYAVSRLLDSDADRAVLGELAQGAATCDELAVRLGLRTAVVRLSLTRLLRSGQVHEDIPGSFRQLTH
ncbi:hypothetical protein [Kitasatospora sp. HPMI-4]|uniref:hypothetical protein n=1 Tax=Kitasatospora sp. HPMI-4 TaxID=3448443 RepID=UPI003F1A7877